MYVFVEEEVISCCSFFDDGGILLCCLSGFYNNYFVGFLFLCRVRLVWMFMVDNKF